MKNQSFNGKPSISVMNFLAAFKRACNLLCIHEGPVVCRSWEFMNVHALPLSRRGWPCSQMTVTGWRKPSYPMPKWLNNYPDRTPPTILSERPTRRFKASKKAHWNRGFSLKRYEPWPYYVGACTMSRWCEDSSSRASTLVPAAPSAVGGWITEKRRSKTWPITTSPNWAYGERWKTAEKEE